MASISAQWSLESILVCESGDDCGGAGGGGGGEDGGGGRGGYTGAGVVGAEASGWPVRAGVSGGQVGVGLAASGWLAGAGRSVGMSVAGGPLKHE